MLRVKGLRARVVDGPEILKGVDLEVNAGELHAVMGPNGSGKSTLSRVLAGHPDYEVTSGSAELLIADGWRDVLVMEPHERAAAGMFLAFQYPVEVPGITNALFLRLSYNAIARARGEPQIGTLAFRKLLKDKLALIEMDESYVDRPVNLDFSGGEKKRNEILQMAVLQPRLAILDETDSGLDVDSLRIVAEGVRQSRAPDHATLMITHYQRILDHVTPDRVHVLVNGRVAMSGGPELAREVESRGYDWVKAPA